MRIFDYPFDIQRFKNAVVSVGTFDGVHMGHQQIILKMREIAAEFQGETSLVTFWPHPRLVVSNNPEEVKLLNTIQEKNELLDYFGLENLVVIPFNKDLAGMDPTSFIKKIIVDEIKAKQCVIGYDHRFGHKREGSFLSLKEKAHVYGYKLTEVGPVEIEGVAVSSSKIRNALLSGNIRLANQFLGYQYPLSGIIKKGLKLGHDIGYPTANIEVPDHQKLIPSDGVYAVKVVFSGIEYGGMLNIGNNPTVSGKGHSIEVHIFDFNQNIYDSELKINFVDRLRDEIKFPGLEELKKQLDTDKDNSLKILTRANN
jgi:riboflavin kinase / FMN adenylyltransferase